LCDDNEKAISVNYTFLVDLETDSDTFPTVPVSIAVQPLFSVTVGRYVTNWCIDGSPQVSNLGPFVTVYVVVRDIRNFAHTVGSATRN
jgi:hypothetical protein